MASAALCDSRLTMWYGFFTAVVSPFGTVRRPSAREGSIPSSVIGIEKGFYALAKYFSRYCQTQLLKTMPTETVQIVHGFAHMLSVAGFSSVPAIHLGSSLLSISERPASLREPVSSTLDPQPFAGCLNQYGTLTGRATA